MPTGYTADVCSGKVADFPTFALQCARAFGALINMRDEPFSAPIPEEFAPHTSYFDERIAAETKHLGEIQAMTNAEAEAAAAAEHLDKAASRAKYIADRDAEASRLNEMMSRVRAWNPPTPDHEGLKEFMLEQLRISLPGDYAPAIPELLDGAAWRKQQIDALAKSIVRHKKSRQEEIDRTANRNAWLKALRSSLISQERS